MSATRNHLVDRYLADLRQALGDLPRRQRDELVAEIEAHLDETLRPGSSDADVLTALDRLGDPDQIAHAERERLGIPEARPGWMEWLAIPLLLVGGVVVPVLGWIAGVALLWLSRCWSRRDKLTATMLLPGGLLPAVYLLLAPAGTETCEDGTGTDSSGHHFRFHHCTGGVSTGARIGYIALELLLVAAPIYTTVRLLRRLPAGERLAAGPRLRAASRHVAAALVLGVIAGGSAVWYYRSTEPTGGHIAQAEVLTGFVSGMSPAGTQFSFHRQSGDDPLRVIHNGNASFDTGTVMSFDDCRTGTCQEADGRSCLRPGARHQPVEVGVVGAEAPTGETTFPAVWVRCL